MPRFLSLAEAVESTVRDGDTVAMEGFTHLIPIAAGHEVIRQQRKRLTLIRMTPDLIYDQLIGMGCADKLVFSWGGNPGVGSLHRFRDAVENGWPQPLAIEEHSHAAMANAYEAGAANLPLRGLPRLHRRRPAEGQSDASSPSPARSPASSSPPCRRIRPDVAIIHALRADRDGNVMIEGIVGVQKEAVLAAKRSIVTVEEIVDDFGAAQPQRGDPAALDRRRGRDRAGRRLSVLCAGLLQARQRLLHRLGQDRARARDVPRLDEGERAGAGAGSLRRACAAVSTRRPRDMADYKPNEMMTIAAARALRNERRLLRRHRHAVGGVRTWRGSRMRPASR